MTLRWLMRKILVLLMLPMAAVAADFNVRDFGAKGDGGAKDTVAIQRAIDACAKAGGGRVVITNGVFLTAPIRLLSNVEFHIAEGAVLRGSSDLADYPEWKEVKGIVNHDALPRMRNACLVLADCVTNVAVTGMGVIDANGRSFVREKTGDWTGWQFERTVDPTKSMPRVFFFVGCRGLRVEDVTLINGPAGWSYWIHDCDDVIFDRCRVKVDVRFPNNDGIHVNSSRDVIIRNCDLETGDDSIIVRANNRSLAENKVCERVVVSNCTMRSWSAGIRIGWTNDGVIRNCVFRDLKMRDCTNGISLSLPQQGGWNAYDYGREPTRFENLLFEDIEMDGVYGRPVFAFVESADKGTLCDGFYNVVLRSVRARCLEKPLLQGRADAIVRLTFDDCDFNVVSDAELPNYRRHGAADWCRRHGDTNRFAEIR